MNIIYRNDNQNNFDCLLNKYIKDKDSSCRYTTLFLDYTRFYVKNLVNDASFILVRDKQPMALAFVPIENIEGKNFISINGSYVQAPLWGNDKAEKEVFYQIDLIAKKYSIDGIKFFLDPLLIKNDFNILRKYGYLDTSSSDCLLNLNKSVNELWRKVRKGHQHDINKIIKNEDFQINIFDHSNPDYKIHRSYVDLHHRCAGKITRNEKTFELQFQMLKNNQATIFELKYKNKPVGYCYFFHFRKGVLYASAVDDPDFTGFPVYHALIWKAIEYYKNHGFEYLEFCEPCGYGIQFDHYLDEKQKNISRFKRGFGGQIIPVFKGIKYFDRKLFKRDMIFFIERYLKVVNNHQ